MAQIALQNSEALLFLPLLWLLLVVFAWPRRFKPFGAFLLRLTIVVCAVLALSQPVLLPPAAAAEAEPEARVVILVDQSASLGETGQQALRAEAARLAQEVKGSIILFFADRSIVVNDPLSPPLSGENVAGLPLNPEVSNLADALSSGAELLNDQPGRLVLLSDGLATEGNTLELAAQLRQQRILVDVLEVDEARRQTWQAGQNEVRLSKLSVPPVLREGETFNVEVTAHSLNGAQATLNLTQDETVLAEDVVQLEPGLNVFTFEASAPGAGSHTFRATLAAAEADDVQSINNSFSAFSQVYPAPQILVVSDELVPVSRFNSQLEQAGFLPHRIRPAELPSRLSELEPYAGMVLLNVSARKLELAQMIAIQEFVRSLGRGLLVTGGRESFSVGNYKDTPLADLLPLLMEPPPREERPPVALLLIIDHSGSMVEQQIQEEATKLVMAKEAAIRATDILGPEDLLGVLMFDNRYEWVVPFQQVSDGAALLEIQRNIARIPGGGGTRILQALEVGLVAFIEQEEGLSAARHAVLLSDGKSFDGLQGVEDYEAIVDAAHEVNITLSTIAIGNDADKELLSQLAERGQGRYHFAAVPDELPALTISESDILRSNAIQEGEFRPAIFAPHPLLRGLFSDPATGTAALPDLPVKGYLAQTPKPRTELVLQVGPGDPLLSVWGYGLGRVVAWTSDAGTEWSSDWLTWPDAAHFWGQVLGYTLPAPDLGLLQLEAELESDQVVILTANGVTATGQTVDLAPTQATLITPGQQNRELTLRQVAPGRYQQRLRLLDPGAYQLSVTQTRPAETDQGDQINEMATIGFILPYPTEYGLPGEGAGVELLNQIATETGGRFLAFGEPLLPNAVAPDSVEAAQEPLELWPWLLQAALILWPVEIAWRRWGRLRIQ